MNKKPDIQAIIALFFINGTIAISMAATSWSMWGFYEIRGDQSFLLLAILSAIIFVVSVAYILSCLKEELSDNE